MGLIAFKRSQTPMNTTMLYLYLLLICIVAASGTETKCEKRLDVISYPEWPILKQLSLELTENAALVNVRQLRPHTGRSSQTVLHDRRNKTYLYGGDPNYDIVNTGEIAELSGLPVKDVQFGAKFIVILTEDGSVWTAGHNDLSQLSGDTASRRTFNKVQGVPAITEIAVGLSNCIARTENGGMFSWGFGELGRHILDSSSGDPTPTIFSLGQGASLPTSICCFPGACMALAGEAEVFTWGNSDYIGRLGETRLPGRVQGIPLGVTIAKVACGETHMVALTASGRLFGWGWNGEGELLQAANYSAFATEIDLGENVVRDVVAGQHLTIVRTDAEEIYYFGTYSGVAHWRATKLEGNLYPRDLMAKSVDGQRSYGSVSLGCDNSELAVRVNPLLIWAMATFIAIGN